MAVEAILVIEYPLAPQASLAAVPEVVRPVPLVQPLLVIFAASVVGPYGEGP